MAFNHIAAKHKIFELARAHQFCDPISSRSLSEQSREEELSALLVLRSQLKYVNWHQVKLWDIQPDPAHNKDSNARASMSGVTVGSLFRGKICVVNEFPLMTTSKPQVQIWGDMKADIVLYESDHAIVLIENKVGASFTGCGDDPRYGQLARQARYLDSLDGKLERYLMLASGYDFFNKYWYSSELFRLIEYRKKKRLNKIKFKLLVWEQIICPEWQPPNGR